MLTEAQMHYYQTTNVRKGTGKIVEIDWSEPDESTPEEHGSLLSENLEGVNSLDQVFSAELIRQVNTERDWVGGIIVAEADFTEYESSLVNLLNEEGEQDGEYKEFDFDYFFKFFGMKAEKI